MSNLTAPRPDTQPDSPPASTPDADEKRKLELSLAQVMGGALAAMTAAALGSTLGLGGTIVGAAFASVIAGVAGTLYTASLRSTGAKVKTVFSGRSANPATEPPPPVRPPRPAHHLSWRRAGIVALATFALAIVALTGYESLTGHALSGGKGTTVEQVGNGGRQIKTPTTKSTKEPTPSASPTQSVSPSESPSAVPSQPVQPSSSTTEPSATLPASPVPTVTPTAAPS
jgi:hypothetical protein